ncbi:MAG: GNAT family N-acetyltransferase [Saprospiraceae bacterium]|nr:GNAT family N-acetyltransferase [Saprospiraceae bacterium]
MEIKTKRLTLIPCNKEILEAMLIGNEAVAKLLNIEAPELWTEFGDGPIQWALTKTEDESENNWIAYLPILNAKNMLIGTCGFKGKPTVDGVIEIGYEVIASKRNRGFAKEIANALVNYGFQDSRVKIVRAHTLPVENASVKVLQYCGLRFIGYDLDPEEGEVWKWELTLEEFQKNSSV